MPKTSKKSLDLLELQGGAIGDNVCDACLEEVLPPLMKEQVLGRTNVGKARSKNQDAASAYAYTHSKNIPSLILTVADGLGAYRCAEKASLHAVKDIPRLVAQSRDLLSSFEEVHHFLCRQEEGKEVTEIGSTTVVLADIFGNQLHFSNVGDSRGYIIRGKEIVFRTQDQSMVEILLHEGRIANPQMARRHPLRNVILNSVGSPEPTYQFIEDKKKVVKLSGLPVISEFTLQKGDFVLLATDGFFNNFLEEEIIRMITKTPWENLNATLSAAVQEIFKVGLTTLGELANSDNYTYIVYRHF